MFSWLLRLPLTSTDCRRAGNRIPLARSRLDFSPYAALLKLNRITKVEKIYSVAGLLAMQCCTQLVSGSFIGFTFF